MIKATNLKEYIFWAEVMFEKQPIGLVILSRLTETLHQVKRMSFVLFNDSCSQ